MFHTDMKSRARELQKMRKVFSTQLNLNILNLSVFLLNKHMDFRASEILQIFIAP